MEIGTNIIFRPITYLFCMTLALFVRPPLCMPTLLPVHLHNICLPALSMHVASRFASLPLLLISHLIINMSTTSMLATR